MSAKRENELAAVSKRQRAFGAFAGGTPAVPANHCGPSKSLDRFANNSALTPSRADTYSFPLVLQPFSNLPWTAQAFAARIV